MAEVASSLISDFFSVAMGFFDLLDGISYEALIVLSAIVAALLVLIFSAFVNNGTNAEAPGQRFQLQPRRASLQLDPCPICLEDTPQLAVQTSCGHHFCGPCFLTLWNDRALSRVACPLCRQVVTILFPAFTAEELAAPPADAEQRRQVDQLLARVNRFNRYNSGQGLPLMDLLRDLPTLVPHLISDLFSPTGFSFIYMARVTLIGVMCLVYLVSPLDILPEAVFGVLGFLDDLVVVLLCFIFVVFMYRNVVSRREFHA